MFILSKVLVVQVEVSIHNGVLALEGMEEGLAGVPSAQSVRDIVDEVHRVLIRVHMKEGRGTSNSSKDTLGSDALDFFKNMYQS